MVSPSRSSTSARGREDVGKLFLGALVLLGLVASVFLVLSDSLQFIRVGLVVALWAAVLGAWAAGRYQAKMRDLRRIYELELEREISARREHELGVESRVRAELGADATEMAALRAELTVLRRQLERLFDGDLPEERPALRASAFRLQELSGAEDRPGLAPGWQGPEEGERRAVDAWANAAAGWSYAADGWVDTEAGTAEPASDTGERKAVTPVYETDHPGRPRFASPDDAPVTAETAIVRLDDDPPYGPPTSEISGPSWSDAFTEVYDEPDGDDDRYRPLLRDEPFYGPPAPDSEAPDSRPPVAAVPATAVAAEPAEPVVDGMSIDGDTREPAASAAGKLFPRSANSRRRRTQSDAAGNRRLSVAEIMANLRQEEEQRSS
ncbi:DUF6779 domain-containing protein [Nocardia rhamnosiphila]|uniref:DUF6779 domain-containing protein n=1 Tax=Nocardia rhamnosiphila TaxID=426716 RepID=A0ABV2X191_9NOCA|nr:DUF6779 domain-containing protein [Nocardia rhamnosiphila]